MQAKVVRTAGWLAVAAATAIAATVASPRTSTALFGIPGHDNAYASTAARRNVVALAWGATANGRTDVYTSISLDAGRTFGMPRRVSDDSSPASLAGEQPPRVTIDTSDRVPSIAVVWTSRGVIGTRLLASISADAGRTFSPPAEVRGSEAAGNRGWQSSASDPLGRTWIAWLDHRELAPSSGAPMAAHSGHHHGTPAVGGRDGIARAQLSKLFIGTLDHGSGRALTGGVCYCCKTAIATGTDDEVYVAWRHVYPGSLRDIAFAMSADGGETFTSPVRVSEDGWAIDGCPENGPSLAVDRRNVVHIVWPTLVATSAGDQTMALFYASSIGGGSFTARQRVPTEGIPRHPQLAIGPLGELAVTWDETVRGVERIAVARGRIDAGGRMQFAREMVQDAEGGEYPAVSSTDSRMLLAWTAGKPKERVIHTRWLSR